MDSSEDFIFDSKTIEKSSWCQTSGDLAKMAWLFVWDKKEYANQQNRSELKRVILNLYDVAKHNTHKKRQVENKLSQNRKLYTNTIESIKAILKTHEAKQKLSAMQRGVDLNYTIADIETWLSFDESDLMLKAENINIACEQLKRQNSLLSATHNNLKELIFQYTEKYSSTEITSHFNELALMTKYVKSEVMADIAQKCSESVETFLLQNHEIKMDTEGMDTQVNPSWGHQQASYRKEVFADLFREKPMEMQKREDVKKITAI